MFKKKWITVILTVSLAAAFLAGCGKMNGTGEETGENIMVFHGNGSIEVSSAEDFDKDYYRETELEQMIDEAVAKSNGTVKKEKFSVRNGKAYLKMSYASFQAYQDFNGGRLYYGPVSDAAEFDISSLDGMVSIQNNNQILSGGRLSGLEGHMLIYMTEPNEIRLPAAPLYVTGNVQVTGKTAVLSEDVSESSPALLILE